MRYQGKKQGMDIHSLFAYYEKFNYSKRSLRNSYNNYTLYNIYILNIIMLYAVNIIFQKKV